MGRTGRTAARLADVDADLAALGRGGYYARLFTLQASGYLAEERP
ncbi:MAG: hypothetical protein ACRDSK_02160 [Actinophytocola sp.]